MKTKRFLLAAISATISFAFFACSDANSVKYGGKVYKTVKIGEQVWFAENLNYEAEGSVCYDDNPDNCVKYGRLYDWETAMKVCPDGWHLPSIEEWDKLLRFAYDNTSTKSPYHSPMAGKRLKTTSGWDNDKGKNGTDEYGFSALPGGGCLDGRFQAVGDRGVWWSASELYEYALYENMDPYGKTKKLIDYKSSYAYYQNMDYYGDAISYKSSLHSVRCIQD